MVSISGGLLDYLPGFGNQETPYQSQSKMSYHTPDAADLPAKTIPSKLAAQAHPVVTNVLPVLILLFLRFGAILLAIIKHAANNELKVIT